MKKGLSYLVQQLLHYNTISIDKNELQFQIESHPSYPSLHSITGVLDHFRIDNLALDIPVNEESLAQLPKTFLAQIISDKRKEFVIATNRGLNYEIIYASKKKNTLNIKNFLNQFTGIMVAVEKTDLTKEKKVSYTICSKVLILLTVTMLLSIYILTQPSLTSLLLFFTSIIGLILSIEIKKQELGTQSFLGDTICSSKSDKKDCNAVLTSKGAIISDQYKLSDISVIYFIALSFSAFTFTLFHLNLTVPLLLTIVGTPITVYSIYYQATVLKTWCTLCLGVVGILWLQASLILATSAFNISEINWISLGVLIISFLVTLSAYNILYPKLTELINLKQTKREFFKFKRNFSLFQTLLKKSKSIQPINNQDFKGVVLGQKEARLNLTIVTNPFCGHCKPVHTLVEDIYNKFSHDIEIQIYFNVNPNEKDNKSTKVVTKLLELYHTQGLKFCVDAMHNIYETQDEIGWLKTYGECNDIEFYNNILEQQYIWCTENDIHFTPEILVNGKSFPMEYNKSDLILFIDDLIENCSLKSEYLELTI